MFQGAIKTVRQNWDELGIAGALGFLAYSEQEIDMEKHGYIIEALRRSRTDLNDASVNEIRAYLADLDEDQIPGLVNNIKGIANEIYYVEAENADGDKIEAHLFGNTNQKDYDVILHNTDTDETKYVQLKATNNPSYIQEAIDRVGEDNVIVTSELAEKMGLQSTGISNEQLEVYLNFVIQELIEDESLWDYVPGLSVWSTCLIVSSMAKRWMKGEISRDTFIRMVAKFTGLKMAKVLLIVAALSVPGLNVVVGAALVAKMVFSIQRNYRA
jgi:hypothetical protein